MTIIHVTQGDNHFNLEARGGDKLSQALLLDSPLPAPPLCSGLGRCGRCRCRFPSDAPINPEDREVLGEEELAAGWRLACHQQVPESGSLTLEIPAGSAKKNRLSAPCAGEAFLGIDLGTTSVQWRLVDSLGESLAEGSFWNPQSGVGADVISRLEAAARQGGEERLAAVLRQAFGQLATELQARGAHIQRACVAGNTAMTEIFLKADISGLLAAPWSLAIHGGTVESVPLEGVGFLPIVIPPLPAPFVGGDISAGLLALLAAQPRRPFLLIDMGTNAEIAFCAQDNALWLASAPLGPAMEGIGPRCGQPAGEGVITSFRIGSQGLCPHFYNDIIPTRCAGISATGYLSLLAILLNTGLMDARGALQNKCASPLARKIAQGLAGDRLNLPGGQYLTPWDIETLLKVKAALAVAIQSVLAAAHCGGGEIQQLFVAGALGNFARMSDLATLGFIPPLCASRAVAVGNTSLEGACMLAVQPEKLAQLSAFCSQAHIINLASDQNFLSAWLAAMRWGW